MNISEIIENDPLPDSASEKCRNAYVRAAELIEAGEFEKAQLKLITVLKEHPGHDGALTLLEHAPQDGNPAFPLRVRSQALVKKFQDNADPETLSSAYTLAAVATLVSKEPDAPNFYLLANISNKQGDALGLVSNLIKALETDPLHRPSKALARKIILGLDVEHSASEYYSTILKDLRDEMENAGDPQNAFDLAQDILEVAEYRPKADVIDLPQTHLHEDERPAFRMAS
ncbi:MAG: hypothetical protein AB8B83_03365 [Bdellovibrionales bacterium]